MRMKKQLFAVLTGMLLLGACDDNNSSEEVTETPVAVKDSLTTIEGEFIYLADAAVLKGRNFIYGVELDSVSLRLADSIAPLKRDEFHMIPVKIRGKVLRNPGGKGWEEVVKISEILEITADPVTEAAPQVNKDLDKP